MSTINLKENRKPPFYVGTAGWSIPKEARSIFFPDGTVKPNHLKAYAQRFIGVEINSSFYREHQASTYLKWAQSTPEEFRFSIKLSKRFTHVQKLKIDGTDLKTVLDDIMNLGEKLGTILIQLPPGLGFDPEISEEFFTTLRELYAGPVVFEPRNQAWTMRDAIRLLEDYQIARVIADPDPIAVATPPVRSAHIAYVRLHGSPKIYYSNYSEDSLQAWTSEFLTAADGKSAAWCIFDNTAMGYATINALDFKKLVDTQAQRPSFRSDIQAYP